MECRSVVEHGKNGVCSKEVRLSMMKEICSFVEIQFAVAIQ